MNENELISNISALMSNHIETSLHQREPLYIGININVHKKAHFRCLV